MAQQQDGPRRLGRAGRAKHAERLPRNEGAVDRDAQRLRESVSDVALHDGRFCGYPRALLDEAFALDVSQLLVVPAMRGRRIVGRPMSRLRQDHRGLTA